MSGHSRWSTIKHQKAATDKKRGQLFTKLANAITIAVKQGGADPTTNFKLRIAIEKAKEQNMPTPNIERAVKRGTGEIEGAKIEETTYEAYGPFGIALLIKMVTDNKNRAISQIRSILTKFGGKLATEGAVSYLFQPRGVIETKKSEEIELAAIDAGAEDIEEQDNTLLIYTKPDELFAIKNTLEQKGAQINSATLSVEPKSPVKIEDKERAEKILKLMDALEECEDVSGVSANFDIEEKLLKMTN